MNENQTKVLYAFLTVIESLCLSDFPTDVSKPEDIGCNISLLGYIDGAAHLAKKLIEEFKGNG